MTTLTLDTKSPDWDQIEDLFNSMYQELTKLGLKIPLIENGSKIWIDSQKKLVGKSSFIIALYQDSSKSNIIGFLQASTALTPKYLEGKLIGHIGHVYLSPEHRQKGGARLLVNEALKWFKDKNVSSIQLQVVSGNQSAQKFWRKLGFEEELIQYRRFL